MAGEAVGQVSVVDVAMAYVGGVVSVVVVVVGGAHQIVAA